MHPQDQLVGVPVREEIHHNGDAERDQHPLLTADQEADAHEERRQASQEKRSAENVHSSTQTRAGA